MSRAFGNRLLKQFVVADPEIQVFLDAHKLCISSIAQGEIQQNPCNVIFVDINALDQKWRPFTYLDTCCQDLEIDGDTEFLILASDGLWDVVPNEVSAIYQIWYMYLHYFLFK